MKVAITSDIHLEFGDWNPSNPENADVLILGGDILVACELERLQEDSYGILDHYKGERYRDFLIKCKENYKHVVYIMGNHEHYHGDFAVTSKVLRKECDDHGVHFLDNDMIKIEDYIFIGGTLWTDMNKRDPLTLYQIRKMMNDFRTVNNSDEVVNFRDTDGKFHTRVAKFSPENAVEQHEKMLAYIDNLVKVEPEAKFVVVGHHAPSKKSTHPRYANEQLMNGGYSSDLDQFIIDRPQIKLWTHGHTHELFDYMVGETRIVCNPRGYVNYERGSDEAEPYLAKVIELP
jgi:Icc-related predicted phosphoesterase